MLGFVPDNLKTKKMHKGEVKKLPFVIRYVPDWYIIKEGIELLYKMVER